MAVVHRDQEEPVEPRSSCPAVSATPRQGPSLKQLKLEATAGQSPELGPMSQLWETSDCPRAHQLEHPGCFSILSQFPGLQNCGRMELGKSPEVITPDPQVQRLTPREER